MTSWTGYGRVMDYVAREQYRYAEQHRREVFYRVLTALTRFSKKDYADPYAHFSSRQRVREAVDYDETRG